VPRRPDGSGILLGARSGLLVGPRGLLLGKDDGQGDFGCAPRPTAGAAVIALDEANDWWRGVLSALSEADLSAPLGPRAGPYADNSKASYVLHQLDEMIHHGAELGVLRDLYAARLRQQC
jgi:hypothetical protein